MGSPVQAFSATISTIIHATEDPAKVAQAIRSLLPTETPVDEKVNKAKGHHGNEIVTMALTTRNRKFVGDFLRSIGNGLALLDRTAVLSSVSSRDDHSGTVLLR